MSCSRHCVAGSHAGRSPISGMPCLLPLPRSSARHCRPGCTHLTVDLPLDAAAAAAAASVPAASLLQSLRTSAGLGPAATRPALLQWQGQLAGAAAGRKAARVATCVPRLRLQPACVAAPAIGGPGPVVRLFLDARQVDGGRAAVEHSTVLCRQAGKSFSLNSGPDSVSCAHLITVFWYTPAPRWTSYCCAPTYCRGLLPGGAQTRDAGRQQRAHACWPCDHRLARRQH